MVTTEPEEHKIENNEMPSEIKSKTANYECDAASGLLQDELITSNELILTGNREKEMINENGKRKELSQELNVVKSEQIRIIPISLPDGKQIINRSIGHDIFEKSPKESLQTNETPITEIESSKRSEMSVYADKLIDSSCDYENSDIFTPSPPQDIDVFNLSNQVFI